MSEHSLKVAFAGTPGLAATVLKSLLDEQNIDICYVLTQPDRPAGRGRKPKASPVKELALIHEIPIEQAQNKNELDPKQQLKQVDVLVVAAYGVLLPEAILNQPEYGALNIHTSLLPRWRGAAPIQRAIQAGDEETGISIMQMDAGLDTGPILLQKTCAIEETETAGELHDKLARLGAEAIIEVLSSLQKGGLKAKRQDDSQASYARKIDKNEAQLDWQRPAIELQRKIRAFNPAPVCSTQLNGQAMRVWQADYKDAIHQHRPGDIIHCAGESIEVACSVGSLQIKQIQIPGKKPVSVKDFLNGRPDFHRSISHSIDLA